MRRRGQAGVGAGARGLLLGDDDPLAAGGSLAGADRQDDALVLNVVRGQRGGRALGGGGLFGGESAAPTASEASSRSCAGRLLACQLV